MGAPMAPVPRTAMEGMRPAVPGRRVRDASRVIAVCLATHAPDPALLARQLASLEAQEEAAWELVRLDDAAGSGAWRAFERCYEQVPAGAAFVAPCDQDDVWHPAKLARLRAAMDPGVTLAFCDLRVVDAEPEPSCHRPTGAGGGRPGSDLGELLATNVVTGAACLVRRDVLDVALPFPPELDDCFHDHWLACCALALGDLRYVPEALVDYVQHGANLTGWSQASRATAPEGGLACPGRARPRAPRRAPGAVGADAAGARARRERREARGARAGGASRACATCSPTPCASSATGRARCRRGGVRCAGSCWGGRLRGRCVRSSSGVEGALGAPRLARGRRKQRSERTWLQIRSLSVRFCSHTPRYCFSCSRRWARNGAASRVSVALLDQNVTRWSL